MQRGFVQAGDTSAIMDLISSKQVQTILERVKPWVWMKLDNEEFGEEARAAGMQDAKEAVQWYLTTLPAAQMLAHWNQDDNSLSALVSSLKADKFVEEGHFARAAKAKEGARRLSLINAPPPSLVDSTP